MKPNQVPVGLRFLQSVTLLLFLRVGCTRSDGEVVTEWLDHHGGKFMANWEVEFSTKIIIFELTVQTTGYIGFGLSVHGGMTKADISIAGVAPDGKPYIGDYHGVGNTMPVRDTQQDWNILSGIENGTHTSIRIYRHLDTCDEEDVVISSDTMNLIWAYGPTDEVTYHGPVRGTHVANLLDSVTIPKDPSSFKEWNVIVDTPMPSTSFSYWCTMHRSPKFDGINHIVGFKPYVYTKEAIEHTHHFVIYKCEAPDHKNEIFEPFVGDKGGECYGEKEMATRPTRYCKNILYDWGAGGKSLFLPEHVGFPIGQSATEYYMLEIHYNNPMKLTNVQFTTGVIVIYTPKLRANDAGMFTVGHTVVGSLLLPPKSKDFMIVGHCSPICTTKGIPPEGVTIFNVLLHTHLTGRKMKLRHFRGNKELEWIAKDDSYHFNFQKNRPLREERKVYPGDQLTFECTYDTTSRPNVTIAGFSTVNEMCEVFIWYYPKIPMLACSSFYDINRLLPPFGIKQVKWLHGFNKDSQPIIVEPAHMVNKTFAEYLDSEVIWDAEQRGRLQNELHYAPHFTDCSTAMLPGTVTNQPKPLGQPPRQIRQIPMEQNEVNPRIPIPNGLNGVRPPPPPQMPDLVGYPNVHDYKPFSKCPRKGNRMFMRR